MFVPVKTFKEINDVPLKQDFLTTFPLLKIYDGFTLILQLTDEIYMIFIN